MPPTKASPSLAHTPRPRKSGKGHIVVLKLSPSLLADFPHDTAATADADSKPNSHPASSTSSNTLPGAASPGENGSESNANTPVPSGTEGSTAMPPPAAVKKTGKGVKRVVLTADGLPKPRGKPGPKKKLKLEDGTLAPAFPTVPKLGPKANQGAINERLRQLDRSGKPCRKWQKGTFKIKSFTGTVWEIPRWQGIAKISINGDGVSEGSVSGSSKENKESSHLDSEAEKSNATDVEMKSSASIPASSPAPTPVATVAAAA